MTKFTKVLLGAFLGAMLVASSSSAAMTWSRSLKQGSKGADVKDLQMFLNMCADSKVANSGAGSPGMETTTFGPATKAAVIKWQMARGVTPASGLFGPLSRAKAAELQASSNVCGGGIVTPPVSGPVSVALSQDNPASGSIVAGQATADLMHITFSGSGTVNSVTLQRGGVSDQNTLSNVYLYDGVQRLTDGYSFNTNGTLTMNNLNLAVNGSRTIAVKADVSSSTTSYDIYTTLTSFSAGTSVNTVSIKGNDMFIAGSGSLATASVSGANTVSAASVNAGTTSYTVWRAPIQVNTRAMWLKAANFRITGSAPSDALQNAGLFVDGVKVAGPAVMTTTNGSNYLSFNLMSSPFSLSTGSHTVEVRGDVVKGSSYNFTVSLQQASDLMVTDPQVGVNIAFSGTIPNTAGAITIGTGTFTASIDPTFSAMTTTTAGSSNATIAKFKIKGYGEDVKVTSLPITPVISNACTSGATYGSAPCNVTTAGATHTQFASGNGLQNVTLYFNGSQIGSQQNWGSGALTFNLGSQMIIPAGADSTLEVRADLRTSPSSSGAADSTATSGANYTAGSVSANLGAATAEGWSSHASITGPTATGNVLTMQAGTLGLSANAGYASQNQAPNTAGVKIGSYVFQNQSSSESVRVTSIATQLTYGAGAGSSNLSALRLSETSGNANVPQQPATAAASGSATNTFSTDFTLAPGATKTVDVFADSGAAAGGTVTVQSAFTVTSLGVTSNISATSSLTSGQTITFQTGTVATPTVVTSSSTVAQLVAAANGGAVDGSKATYNFTSSNSSSTISELTFTVAGTTTASSLRIGSVTAPVVGGTAYFTGLNIAVPNGGSGVNVDVFVSYPEVGTSGLASATTSAITLTTVKYTSGSSTTTLGSLTVAAPTMTLVGSKPAYAVIDSTETLVNGSVKIAEVTVTADAKGDIKLGQLPISVSSTGVVTVASAADNILVKDTSGATIATKNATFAVAAGGTGTANICFDTATAACASGQAAANGYLIPAGTSKTFRIYVTAATVSGATGTTSLSTKLGVASSATYYDVAGGSTSAQAATLLYGYPTDTSVISN